MLATWVIANLLTQADSAAHNHPVWSSSTPWDQNLHLGSKIHTHMHTQKKGKGKKQVQFLWIWLYTSWSFLFLLTLIVPSRFPLSVVFNAGIGDHSFPSPFNWIETWRLCWLKLTLLGRNLTWEPTTRRYIPYVNTVEKKAKLIENCGEATKLFLCRCCQQYFILKICACKALFRQNMSKMARSIPILVSWAKWIFCIHMETKFNVMSW